MVGAGQKAPRPQEALQSVALTARRSGTKQPLPRGPVLYVVIANDFPFFKVGSTGDLKTRAAQLRWVMPGGMRLLAWWRWARPEQSFWSYRTDTLRSREMDLHARLDPWLVAGEWFRATPESLALVESWRRRLPRAPKGLRVSKVRRRLLADHYRGAA